MTPLLTNDPDDHLTDQEFAALLDGWLEEGCVEHLAACGPCRAEVAGLESSILNFRVAVTGYSAARAPGNLMLRPVASIQLWRRPRAVWAAGLVAAMALCTASISVLHHPAARMESSRTDSAHMDASTDSRLLEDIDEDVSDSVPPSLQPLDVSQVTEHRPASTHN